MTPMIQRIAHQQLFKIGNGLKVSVPAMLGLIQNVMIGIDLYTLQNGIRWG